MVCPPVLGIRKNIKISGGLRLAVLEPCEPTRITFRPHKRTESGTSSAPKSRDSSFFAGSQCRSEVGARPVSSSFCYLIRYFHRNFSLFLGWAFFFF